MMTVFRGWAPALFQNPGPSNHGEGSTLEADAAATSDSGSDCKTSTASDSEPGTDIRTSLASLLSDNLSVTGAFSYSRTYTEWCNPGISIDGFGTLGLPLNPREAAHLEDALAANGYHVGQVRFNKEWNVFLNGVVDEVCHALGVDAHADNPRIELNELVLSGVKDGSALTNLCPTVSAPAFATLLVVLPSTSHGGAFRVTHGDRTETCDYCIRAGANLTVLAWRAGALPEFAPLTDGHHLALCYRVLLSTDAPIPVISTQDEVVSRLREVLSRWDVLKREGKSVPRKTVHLLHNKYSRNIRLRHDVLTDADSRAVSLLANIGKLHGFTVGLADMRCVVYGFANAESREDHDHDSDTQYEAEVDWRDSCLSVDKTEITIRRLVHLDGNVIRPTLDYDVEMESTYPTAKVIEAVVAGKHDKEYYNITRSNQEYRRVYYRNVAVLWPKWAHFEIMYGPNGIWSACEQLRTCAASEPTPEDMQLVEDILIHARAPHLAVTVSSVCSVALKWNDHALWLRAVNSEKSISTMGRENVENAVNAFGFQKVQLCLEQAMEAEPSDVVALQFLDDLETWCEGQDSLDLVKAVPPWVAAQRAKRYSVLREPAQDDYEVLTALVVKHRGGSVMFKHKILPKITASENPSLMIRYVTFLQSDRSPNLHPTVLSEAVEDLLRTALDRLNNHLTSPANLTSLMRAISTGGHWHLLNARVVPGLETIELDSSALAVLLSALHANRAKIGPAVQNMMLSLFKRWAALLPTDSCTSVDALEFPITLGVPEACSFVCERSVDPSVVIGAEYVRNRLVPLLEAICTVCSKHDIPVRSPHTAPAIRSIMLFWTTTVMGPPPDFQEVVQLGREIESRWDCPCKYCVRVRASLIHGAERMVEHEHVFSRLKKVRHTQKLLNEAAGELATCEVLPRVGHERTFRVIKTERLFVPGQWKKDREQGDRMLQAISDDDLELQAVLGDDYQPLVAALRSDIPELHYESQAAVLLRAGQPAVPEDTPSIAAPEDVEMCTDPVYAAGSVHLDHQAAYPVLENLATNDSDEPPAKRRKT